MKLNPISIFYLFLGACFIVAAVYTADETIWNFSTILFMALAAYDIKIGLGILFRKKSNNNS